MDCKDCRNRCLQTGKEIPGDYCPYFYGLISMVEQLEQLFFKNGSGTVGTVIFQKRTLRLFPKSPKKMKSRWNRWNSYFANMVTLFSVLGTKTAKGGWNSYLLSVTLTWNGWNSCIGGRYSSLISSENNPENELDIR